MDACRTEMVLEVLAYSVILIDNANLVLSQLLGRANSTELKNLGRVDGTAAKKDFALGVDLVLVARLGGLELDADCFRFVGRDKIVENSGDMRTSSDKQIAALLHLAVQVCSCHRRTAALGVDEGLEAGNTKRAVGSVDVFIVGDSGLFAARDPSLLDDWVEVGVARLPLAFCASVNHVDRWAIWVWGELFHAAEVWSNVVVAPALAPKLVLPLVKVGLGAVVVHHGVHGGAATEHAAAGPVELTVGNTLLLGRVIVPVVLSMEELAKKKRSLGFKDLVIASAGFQDENSDSWVFGKLASQDTACGTSANNYCKGAILV